MINNWLQWLPLLIFPVIVVVFNYIIRRKIPHKKSRKQFKKKNEYLIKLIYLFTPLLLLYLELLLLNTSYFNDLNTPLIVVLILLQAYLFVAAVIYLVLFFKALNKYKD
jgi:hypothetical protein